MRICAGQTRPATGDVQVNIARHRKLIALAVSHRADLIVFPELSLTGYEPQLAGRLAANQDDARFDDFQIVSNRNRITIGVGMPTTSVAGILISMLVFQPHLPRRTYSKKYLHPDEERFFVPGTALPIVKVAGSSVALAICYEITIPDHLDTILEWEPAIYVASVAKTLSGVAAAGERLSDIAKRHAMPVLMSNSVGPSDGAECGGRSSVWNSKGLLVGQLDAGNEGILLFDTETQEWIGLTE